MRRLVLVLGDQLDAQASAFDGFDPAQDAVWMAEVAEESTHNTSGQPRNALFLSALPPLFFFFFIILLSVSCFPFVSWVVSV